MRVKSLTLGFVLIVSPFSSADVSLPIQTKIVGGVEAAIGEFPYIVSLQDKDGHFCGGSLIKKNWVLTAAHCVDDISSVDRVVIGLHSQKDWSHSEIKTPKQVIRHPLYSEKTMDYDFALIQLSSDSAFPTIDLNTREFKVRKGQQILMTIAGWGSLSENEDDVPDRLQKVDLPLISKKMCRKIYPKDITARMLCAGIDRGGKDSCQGDSGGPMVYNDEGHLVLVGVVSWGDGCARAHKFGMYSKVSAAVDWIDETIQSSDEL